MLKVLIQNFNELGKYDQLERCRLAAIEVENSFNEYLANPEKDKNIVEQVFENLFTSLNDLYNAAVRGNKRDCKKQLRKIIKIAEEYAI